MKPRSKVCVCDRRLNFEFSCALFRVSFQVCGPRRASQQKAIFRKTKLPGAALADSTHSDLSPLEELLAAGERVYLIGPQPQPTRKLNVGPPLHCLQMLFPSPPPSEGKASEVQILRLTPEDAPAMVALTDLAFPGFFRPRTNEMGTYYGIRINGELVAMAGERLAVPGFSESPSQ